MNCNKCGTANDAGSKYCKECGERLLDTSRTTALNPDEHLKIGEFVYLAYRESEAGHLDNAIEACRGALGINDANPAIHGLLGSLYERKGDLARAIYEYERVVSLNPGSLDDRRKLEQLRAQLLSPVSFAAPPARPRFQFSDIKWFSNPKVMPWVASIAAFIVVVFVSSMIFGERPNKQSAPTGERVGTHTAVNPNSAMPGQPGVYGPNAFGPSRPGTGQPMIQQPGAAPRQDDEEQPANPSGQSADRRTRPGIPSVRLPGSSSASQPPVREPEEKENEDEKPVIVPIPRPQPGGSGSSAAPKPTSPAPSPVIRPSKSAEERGIELQRMGKYDEAISAYREALNQTSDSGRIYENIARSYQRKGEHDAAIENYNRAISAYRDQLASGRDRADVDRKIRACEAGIEVSRNMRK